MDAEVMPAVLAYKSGELFKSVMRIVDEIPSGRSLSTESLELVLQRYVHMHYTVRCVWRLILELQATNSL